MLSLLCIHLEQTLRVSTWLSPLYNISLIRYMNRLVVTSKMSSRYFEPNLPHLEKYTLKNYIEKFHFPYLKLEEES